MKFPKPINSYYVGNDILKLCEHFASQSYLSNIDCYKYRKQTSPEKIQQDIMLGKLAEWGVYFIYLQRGRTDINTPDMSIYPSTEKSFEADLQWSGFNLHIKSQTYESAQRYGDSWVFQAKDPLFTSATEHDIVIGCRMGIDFLDGCHIEIRLERSFSELVFGETKMKKFQDNKRAIYLKDNE